KANAAYASLPSLPNCQRTEEKPQKAKPKSQQKQALTEPLDPANKDQFSGIKVTKPCRQRHRRRR
ncbi:hypothetical protein, partial [Roseibium album]